MQTDLQHIQILIRAVNIPFYKDLFSFLGWTLVHADESMMGVLGQGGVTLWLTGWAKELNNDYDGPGMNHIAIGTKTQKDVDAAADYLKEKGVPHLFDTPRHRPDFVSKEGHTYYQVMFESPDRILFEIVYTGPKDV